MLPEEVIEHSQHAEPVEGRAGFPLARAPEYLERRQLVGPREAGADLPHPIRRRTRLRTRQTDHRACAEQANTYFTQPLGHGFDKITASNLILVDQDLNTLSSGGIPNPANRFHTWIYRARPDVNCIIHTYPLHVAALSILEVPLQISHMDMCPLCDNCAFLKDWPGVSVGNEEGEIILAALGDKRAILL